VARENETTNSYLRQYAGICLSTAARSQNRSQEHINDLPVHQEYVNQVLPTACYRKHIDNRGLAESQ